MSDLQSIIENYSLNTTALSLMPSQVGQTDGLASEMRKWGNTSNALGLLTRRSALSNFLHKVYFLVIGKPYFQYSPIELLDMYFSQTQQVNAGLSQHVDCLKTQLARTDEFCNGLIVSEGEAKHEYAVNAAALAKQRAEYNTLVNQLSMTRHSSSDYTPLCTAEYNLHIALKDTERKYLLLAARIPCLSEHIGGTRAIREQLEASLTFATHALQGTSDILVMAEQLRPVLEATVLTGVHMERVASEVQMLRGAAATVMEYFWNSAGAMSAAYTRATIPAYSTIGRKISDSLERAWDSAAKKLIAGCDKHLEQKGIPYLQTQNTTSTPSPAINVVKAEVPESINSNPKFEEEKQ